MKANKISGIYKITSPSGKIYIGKTMDMNKRWNLYKHLHCKSQIRLYNSFLKHGVENHTFEIICECTEGNLNELECYYINFFDTFDTDHGLNLCSGGQGGRMSKESIEKVRKSNTGKKHTEETKQRLREIKTGSVMSEETKEKLSKTMTGKKFSDETKQRMSESAGKHLKGNKQSPEHIEKLRQARIGKKMPEHVKEILRNTPQTEETRESKRKSMKEYWEKKKENGGVVITEETKNRISDGLKKYWDSLSEEERIKINKSRTGKVRTEEHKLNYSKAQKKIWENKKDVKLPEETKEKIRKSLIGNKRRLGTKHSDEDRSRISEGLKENWKDKKNSDEYNSEESKRKRSEIAKHAATVGAEKRRGKSANLSEEQKQKKSVWSKNMWAKRRALGLKNKKETKKRKKISEESRKSYAEARKREIESPEYYSEENIKKRRDSAKKAHRTRAENKKMIEQERLTMIF